MGLPDGMRPIGGFYSCPLCHGTGKMMSMKSFLEQVIEDLEEDSDLLEAAHLAVKSLNKK
jgi:20S proteasome alpha/beta subunit